MKDVTHGSPLKAAAASLAAALALAGCQTAEGGPKQQGGIPSGAGRSPAAAADDGLLAAFAGGEIVRSLDPADRRYMRQAEQRAHAAPIGRQVTWQNPRTGHFGTIVTTGESRDRSGRHCRELQQAIHVGGRAEQARGTACQEADGTWRILS